MPLTLLTEEALAAALTELPHWRVEGGELQRTLRFASYGEAVAFTVQIALLAERLDHHPDLYLRYTLLEIRLMTHDVGGLTARDIRLAAAIEALSGRP